MTEFRNDGSNFDLKFELAGRDSTGSLVSRISVIFKDMSFPIGEHQILDLFEYCEVKAHLCRGDGEILRCESATPQQIVCNIVRNRPENASVYSTLKPEACWHRLQEWCRHNGIEFGVAKRAQ